MGKKHYTLKNLFCGVQLPSWEYISTLINLTTLSMTSRTLHILKDTGLTEFFLSMTLFMNWFYKVFS